VNPSGTQFRRQQREKGSETGFHKGRRITRDANILAGFENPDPDGTRHAGT